MKKIKNFSLSHLRVVLPIILVTIILIIAIVVLLPKQKLYADDNVTMEYFNQIITELENKIDNLEGQITILNTELDEKDVTISQLSSKINTNIEDISNISSNISSIKTDVSNIKLDKTNLYTALNNRTQIEIAMKCYTSGFKTEICKSFLK